ncbi:MAG: HNH endonuclease [Vampirovibrionales bacterium]
MYGIKKFDNRLDKLDFIDDKGKRKKTVVLLFVYKIETETHIILCDSSKNALNVFKAFEAKHDRYYETTSYKFAIDNYFQQVDARYHNDRTTLKSEPSEILKYLNKYENAYTCHELLASFDTNNSTIEEIDLDRELRSVGKAVFVQCFEIVRTHFTSLNRDELAALMEEEVEQKYGNTSDKNYAMKATFAKRIFQRGLEYQALELCLNAPKLDVQIKKHAQDYLNEADQADQYMTSNHFQETINRLKLEDLEENDPLQLVPIEIPKKSLSFIERIQRKACVVTEALIKAEYKCALDESHQTFIQKRSGNPYMEAHHLIPLKAQHRFGYSLDVPSNVVSLCPNCHRKVHYADSSVQKEVLESLLEKHQADLKQQGLEVPLDTLLNYYG